MANNVVPVTPGTGADIAGDLINTTEFVQGVKVIKGGDGVDGGFVTDANPFPTLLSDGTNSAQILSLGSNPTNANYGVITQAMIHGHTTAGGGAFVDVKVNPSGALTVAASQDGTWNVGNSGTFAVQENGAALTSLQLIDDAVATTASAIPSKGLAISGTDGTNARVLKTDASGELQVDVQSVPAPLNLTGNGDSTGVLRVTVANDSSGVTEVYGLGINNNDPLSTTLVPVMPAVASVSDLSYTDGRGVVLRTNLAGDLVVSLAGESITVGSHAVTNAGTFVVQENGAALTSLQLIDDAIATTASAITSKGMAISGTDGTNARVLKTDTSGELQVDVLTLPNVTIGSALPAGSNAIGKLAANSGVTIGAVEIAASQSVAVTQATASSLNAQVVGNAASAATDSGNPIKVGGKYNSTQPTFTDGQRGDIQLSSRGAQIVSTGADTFNVTVNAALPAGTNAIGKLAANTGVTIGAVEIAASQSVAVTQATASNLNAQVVGPAAHDAAISGNPVRIAGRALSSDYTAVGAGDTADIATTLTGKQLTYPFALPGQTWNYAAASGGITNTTGVTIKAAAGAGVRNYITCLTIVNGHASVGTDVQIRDGASGTVLYRFYAVANGGGVREVFSVPIRGSANTLLEVACGTTGSATYVNVQGFTAAE